jgi:tubulin polyglutamylase TTLL6/13
MEDVPKEKKKKTPILFFMGGSKYEVVRDAAESLGYVESTDENDYHLQWIDTSVSIERVKRLKPFQKINHFPGMLEICRKAAMGRNLNRLKLMLPHLYNFYPKTFVLPSDYSLLRQYMEASKKRTVIVKPSAGCQGKGIYMTRRMDDILPFEDVVVQKYLHTPFLIDGYKFDMRVYVLVTSVDPIEIWLYEDGLVRICTEKYVEPNGKNLDCAFMHLTNYAINKNNEGFVQNSGDDESATKRSIEWFMKWLRANGHDDVQMWTRVGEICIKSILSIASHLKQVSAICGANEKCFEILGFDIMLDHKLRPWLIEINHSPSFSTDSELDYRIKHDLIASSMRMMHMRATLKKKFEKYDREESRRRLMSSGAHVSTGNLLPGPLQPFSKSATIAKREKTATTTLFRKIFPVPETIDLYAPILEAEKVSSAGAAAPGGPVIIPRLPAAPSAPSASSAAYTYASSAPLSSPSHASTLQQSMSMTSARSSSVTLLSSRSRTSGAMSTRLLSGSTYRAASQFAGSGSGSSGNCSSSTSTSSMASGSSGSFRSASMLHSASGRSSSTQRPSERTVLGPMNLFSPSRGTKASFRPPLPTTTRA